MKILTEATVVALWHGVLQDAQSASKIILHADLEAYLIFMLMRYASYQQLAREVMATKFLSGMQSTATQRDLCLQKVGDQCLLITGLFPAVAEKRRVKLSYYIEMGQLAYEVISRKNNDVFSALSKQFIPLMDILQNFRPYTPQPIPLAIRQTWERLELSNKNKK
jgi:hypothetical protein